MQRIFINIILPTDILDTLKINIKIDFKIRYIKIAINRINIRYKVKILKIDTPEEYIIKLIKTQRFRDDKY